MLNILADENIPFAREAFGTLGEVRLLPGRAITRETLREVQVLLVRSITTVNAALLQGTPVRFVGTATIGFDHIAREDLQASNISFASAIGSNANSVAEYVVAALLHWAVAHNATLAGKTLGVVGAGHVGRRVIPKARALGMAVLVNDPPLARYFRTAAGAPEFEFLPLSELMQADFITLHTPLTLHGPDATHHLFDETRLRAMRRDGVLLNTARGPVVDNAALKKILQTPDLAGAILDVWENEPLPDPELLRRAHLATPHIAGYSFDGKVQGTWQIYEALCRFLRVAPSWEAAPYLPAPSQPVIMMGGMKGSTHEILHQVVRRAYDLAADDSALRAGWERREGNEAQRGQHFDHLRRVYPTRREFGNYTVQFDQEQAPLAETLRALGFQTAPASQIYA